MTTSKRPNRKIPALEKARKEGLPQYKGKPCRYGHDGMRYTCNNVCVTCQRMRVRHKGVLMSRKKWEKLTKQPAGTWGDGFSDLFRKTAK